MLKSFMIAGQYESAIQQWSAITNLFPVFEMPYFKIGNLLGSGGNTLMFLNILSSALKINPESAESLSGIGVCLLNLQKYNEAITVLKKAIKLNQLYGRRLLIFHSLMQILV